MTIIKLTVLGLMLLQDVGFDLHYMLLSPTGYTVLAAAVLAILVLVVGVILERRKPGS